MSDTVKLVIAEAPTTAQRIDALWSQLREQRRQLSEHQRAMDNAIAGHAVRLMAEREQTTTTVAKAEPEPPPLTMAERAELDAYGCAHRAERLREIADAKGLRLDVPAQRQQAEAALFAEADRSVMHSQTLVEAIHSLAREKGLSFVELKDGATYADLTRSVVTLRPSLKPDYRSGRPTASSPTDPLAEVGRLTKRACDKHGLDFESDRQRMQGQAIVFAEHPELARALYEAEQQPTRRPADAQRAVAFMEKVNEALRDQDCPATPSNRVRAAASVAKEFPHLAPRGYRR